MSIAYRDEPFRAAVDPISTQPGAKGLRICFVTPRFPYPADRGDKVRAYHQLRTLGTRHSITLFSLTDERVSAEAIAEVGRFCEIGEIVHIDKLEAGWNVARALFDGRPLQAAYYSTAAFGRKLRAALAENRFDVIHACTARVTPHLTDLDANRVLLDLIDAQSLGLRSRRDRLRFPVRLAYGIELSRVEHGERSLVRRFRNVVVTGDADRRELGASSIELIKNGVDLGRFTYADEGREELHAMMTGTMGYQPNIDGALWFAANVWPIVRRKFSAAQWSIVGARPAASIRALDGRDGIRVVGPVSDVGAYLRRATVAVAPILCGAGIQNKVLEAFASGAPVVATSFANEGIQGNDGEHVLISDDPARFAAFICGLFDDAGRRRALARNARGFVESGLTWEAHAAQLERLYEQIAGCPLVTSSS